MFDTPWPTADNWIAPDYSGFLVRYKMHITDLYGSRSWSWDYRDDVARVLAVIGPELDRIDVRAVIGPFPSAALRYRDRRQPGRLAAR